MMHKVLEAEREKLLFNFAYLLWWDVERQSTHVHLLIGINAGYNEEDTGSPGPAGKETT